MPARVGTDGSPAMTCVAPLLCVHRSQVPALVFAWLNNDCAKSLPTSGSMSVTSWACERYTSQPEKLLYCARWWPRILYTFWSKPRYSPVTSLATFGSTSAWYSAV